VFVSHDRHFIDGLATRIIEVQDGKLNSYYGDYEYYLEKKGAMETHAITGDKGIAGSKHVVGTSPVHGPRSLLPLAKEERQRQREEEKHRQREERQRQKRLAELEGEIEDMEGHIAELERKMADPAFFADHEAARTMGEEHSLLSHRVSELYAEWEKRHS
jgi:ATP-binding cassette subfamily F protein 3